ncbi:peptidase [Bacillus sp. FJAT-21352]|nr:peptidase [Bacillus sp. FJAT-21352]
MSLKDISGNYDAIFSLGDLCLAAIQLRKNNLRPFAGVLDWVGSPTLPYVNRLLQNQFADFLNPHNLKPIKYLSQWDLYVLDEYYNIGFNHDFKTDKNTLTHLGGYPEVKEKYDRRIQRFLEKMTTSQRILFVRTEGTFEDVKELESILSGMVKHDFRILVVNHTEVNGIVEKSWPLEKVCVIELPNHDKWNANDYHWKTILSGVHINV